MEQISQTKARSVFPGNFALFTTPGEYRLGYNVQVIVDGGAASGFPGSGGITVVTADFSNTLSWGRYYQRRETIDRRADYGLHHLVVIRLRLYEIV
jgi:hypothetical protein